MSTWNKFNKLANEILDDKAPIATKFSAHEKSIIPEQGQGEDKMFSADPPPTTGVTALDRQKA